MKRSIFHSGGSTIRDLFRFNLNSDSKISLIFRLFPNEEGYWILEGFVQSEKDESLLIPLNKSVGPLTAAKLVKAAKFSRFLSEFKGSRILSMTEAYEFLSSDALLLQNNGFLVRIPDGVGSKKSPSLVLKNKLVLGRNGLDLFSFDYKCSIGDLELTDAEFQIIANAKIPLVKIRGRWINFDAAKADQLQKIMNQSNNTLRGAIRMNLDAAITEVCTEISSRNKHYASLFELAQEQGFRNIKAPKGFNGVLRNYQLRGISWLEFIRKAELGGLLADDMGLGKTIQIIAHITNLLNEQNAPCLIICPTSVISNWLCEFARFSPNTIVKVHHGTLRTEDSFKHEANKASVILTSYGLAWRDEKEISRITWALVVLDEAQNIKNPFTKQSRTVRKLNAKHKIALTGTPIENRLSDLWSIIEFINPGLLGSWDNFKENFAKPIELQGNEMKKTELRKALAPMILRRLKTDKKILPELPDKIESIELCNLTAEQATLYQAVVNASLERINEKEGESKKMEIFATIIKLKQICNHPSNLLKDSSELKERSGKVERLRELLATIVSGGESVLVFSQFTEMACILYENLKKELNADIYYFNGSLSRKKRDELIDNFQKQGRPKVLILSLKAGGTGLNLTNANNVIHFDRWWNPAVENQATDRTHRIGQQKKVFVYKLVTKGTIEEKIHELLLKKKELAASIITDEESLASLPFDKLKEFLRFDSDSD